MNTLAPLDAKLAEERVLGWQTKLHRWAAQDEQVRFGDLFNLVCDPATLLVAWERVKRNRGSRTAGADGQTRRRLVERHQADDLLVGLQRGLQRRTRQFQPPGAQVGDRRQLFQSDPLAGEPLMAAPLLTTTTCRPGTTV